MTGNVAFLLFLIPFGIAVATPIIGLRYRHVCRPLVLGGVGAMFLVSLWSYRQVLASGPIEYQLSGWPAPYGILWVLDGLSGLLMIALSGIGVVALLFAGSVEPRHLGGRIVPYYTLISMLISALTGITLSADLFNIFVFLEVGALCSYGLVGIAGGRALISAFRYLILGTIGASIYLLGVGYLYAATGTLNMQDLALRLPEAFNSKAVLIGLTFLFIGLAIKMALVPMHGWLPDAYAHAPEAITPLLASLVTKVALYAVIRITFWVLGAGAVLEDIPMLLLLNIGGILATVIGAFLALTQRDLKRMFAYGGISHVGLILMGMTLGNDRGFAGGLFYLINDAVMQATLFFIAGSAMALFHASDLDQLPRLRGQSPWLYASLIVMAMSMIGIPPTGGFFGKWYIVLAAIEVGNWPAVGAVLGATLLTMGYFIRIIERMVLERGTRGSVPRPGARQMPLAIRVSMGALTAAILGLGIFSDQLMTVILTVAIPSGL